MISYEEALRKAHEYLQDSEIPLKIMCQEEVPEGWIFFFNSLEYAETGNLSAQLAGNGPFLIERSTGEIHTFGTDKPLWKYLEEYRSKLSQ